MNVYPDSIFSIPPDKKDSPEYLCPVCGAQLDGGDTLAENIYGDIVGCYYCIRYFEIWEK